MSARTLIDAEFPSWYHATLDRDDDTMDHGAVFLNTNPPESDDYKLHMGWGFYTRIDDFRNACQAYVDAATKIRKAHFAAVYGISPFELEKAPTMWPEDPLDVIDGAVAVYKEVVVRRLANHPRAQYELLSRRKVPNLNDSQLHMIEEAFPSMTPDDVVLWRRHLKDPGQLVYAGVAFFGERDILANSPNWEPKASRAVKKLVAKQPIEGHAEDDE